MAPAEMPHHTAPRGQSMARAGRRSTSSTPRLGDRTLVLPRRQAQCTLRWTLTMECLPPGLAVSGSQERVLRHNVEQIAVFAPVVQIIDLLVPQMVGGKDGDWAHVLVSGSRSLFKLEYSHVLSSKLLAFTKISRSVGTGAATNCRRSRPCVQESSTRARESLDTRHPSCARLPRSCSVTRGVLVVVEGHQRIGAEEWLLWALQIRILVISIYPSFGCCRCKGCP